MNDRNNMRHLTKHFSQSILQLEYSIFQFRGWINWESVFKMLKNDVLVLAEGQKCRGKSFQIYPELI